MVGRPTVRGFYRTLRAAAIPRDQANVLLCAAKETLTGGRYRLPPAAATTLLAGWWGRNLGRAALGHNPLTTAVLSEIMGRKSWRTEAGGTARGRKVAGWRSMTHG